MMHLFKNPYTPDQARIRPGSTRPVAFNVLSGLHQNREARLIAVHRKIPESSCLEKQYAACHRSRCALFCVSDVGRVTIRRGRCAGAAAACL
jgi:hypothetical protein